MTTRTTHLLPSRRAQLIDWLRHRDPWLMLSVLMVLIAALVSLRRTLPETPRSAPVPTLAPVILVATAVSATPIPIAFSSGEAHLSRAIIAYDAPDGHILGAVEPGRRYEVLARSGTLWVQLAIDGSGNVWVRRDDLEDMPDVATVAPLPQPLVIAVQHEAPEQEAPAATAIPEAAATPEVTTVPSPTVPRTIVYVNPDGSVFLTYVCRPYGDWRDSDPFYVHPECTN